MKYRVTLEDKTVEIDVQIEAGRATVSVDGALVDVDARPIPGGFTIHWNGRVFDVLAGGKPEAMTLAAGAHRGVAVVESERSRAKKGAAGGAGGGKELRAPMPGRIVRVLATVGAEVEAGQPLVVMEAMKMENELRAPSQGVVATVDAREGTSVESGALLVTLK